MAESGGVRSEATREAILAAAEQVFAEHGFDGARVDAIAYISGYNKTLIFRYFGDKLGLYATVLRRADREANELFEKVCAPFLKDEARVLQAHEIRVLLETMLHTFFDYLHEHPRFVRILTWEMASGWQTYAQIASQFSRHDGELFERLFRRGQRVGLFRSDFAPVLQLATIGQLYLTYLASLPIYQLLLPTEDLASAESHARARSYIVNFIMAGMLADPRETEKGSTGL